MSALLITSILTISVLATGVPLYAQSLLPAPAQNASYADPEIGYFFKDPDVSRHPLLEEISSPTIKINESKQVPAAKKYRVFLDFINNKAYAADTKLAIMKNDKTVIRQEWNRVLGVDIFYPYFKAKEIEDWISEKGSIKIGNLKGKPKFEDNKFRYVFKMKF